MNTRAGRIPLITLFLLVLLGSLVPLSQLMPGRASADYLSDAQKQERAYEYGVAIGECIGNGSGLHTENISLVKPISEWMNGGKVAGSFYNSLIIPDKSSPWCGDLLKGALDTFGYTPGKYEAFLTDLKYTCSATECNLPSGAPQQGIPASYQAMLSARNIPTSQTDSMKYVMTLTSMQSYCSLVTLAAPSDPEKAAGEGGEKGFIMLYTTGGDGGTLSVSKSYYKYDAAGLDDSGSVALAGGYDGACIKHAQELQSLSKTISDATLASFTKQSTAFEKDAITAAVCGSAPIGDGPLERYAACITKVSTAYDKCLAQAGSAGAYYTQTKEEYTAALAACIATDTGASVDTIRTALAEAASKISDLAGNLTTTTAAGSTAEDNCPLPAGTSLRWLGCAVFDGLYDIANGITSAVNSLLYTPSEIFEEEAARKAANVFRNIGIALVVIAALFMVISEASGWQIVDAYTIRKLMPRMAIVLAAIALAWPLLRLAVELTNDLGALIHSVFLELASEAQATGDSTGAGSSITSLLLWLLGGGGVLVVLGGAGLLSLIATIVLALLIGLFVLSIRQLVVLMCIILAPIAFASYVLPGTQKLWAFWKNTFMTTLLMYPLIMGFIGAGKAMSFLLGATNMSTQSNIMQLLVVIVYFAPYFMLPFAFKMAGGLMSTIFSMANDKNRGVFDRLKKHRGNQIQKNLHDMKDGNRFKYSWAQGINRGLGYGSNINKAGLNPFQMRSRMRTHLDDTAHDKATKLMKEDDQFKAIAEDDAKLWASQYTTRQQIEDELERRSARYRGAENATARADAANQIIRAQKTAGSAVFQRARTRAQAPTGTAYYDEDGNLDISQMIEDVHAVYGSDRNGAWRALNEMRGALTQSGQIAGQASYGTWVDAFEDYQKGVYTDPTTGQIDRQALHNVILDDATNQANPSYALHGKPTSAAAMGAAHLRRIQTIATGIANGTHTQEDLDVATSAAAGLLDAMGSASPANASAFANELMGKVITGSGRAGAGGMGPLTEDLTVRQMIEARMENPEFVNRRRDMGHSVLSQSQANLAQITAGTGTPPPTLPSSPPGPVGPP